MTVQENQRWGQVVGFLQSHGNSGRGYTVRQVQSIMAEVLSMRLEPAHGTAAEVASVTDAQLETWAQEVFGQQTAAYFMPWLLELAAFFSEPGQPLVAKNPRSIQSMLEHPSQKGMRTVCHMLQRPCQSTSDASE
jgi:hypothetical protein